MKENKIMKRKLIVIPSAAAALMFTFTALAEHTPDQKTDHLGYNRDGASQSNHSDQLNEAAKASDIIGMTVKNYQDEKLGKVNDLAVDVASGRIVQVIVSSGGFLGMGDTLVAVPPGALHHDIGQKVLHLDADQAKLKAAPKFDSSKWDENSQSTQASEVYAYFDQQPYFGANREGYETTAETNGAATADIKRVQTLPRHMDGTYNTQNGKLVDNARDAEAVNNAAASQNTLSTRNADGTWKREYSQNANQSASSGSSLGYVQLASKLMGKSVINRQNEKLGDVENILVDIASGRIVAVIIASGGFLEMGEELSAIPPTALSYSSNRVALQLDASKEMLTAAPHFKASQWPNFNQPSYASEVYRAYQVEPYFNTGGTNDMDNTRQNIRDRDNRITGTTEPDNAARNIRDRDNRTLTPLNQGNSTADIATTAQIRKEIIAGKNMSVNARNVKIITNDGQITLRGPVNTAEEKRLIGEIAERSPHSGKVDNQLEIQSSNNDYK